MSRFNGVARAVKSKTNRAVEGGISGLGCEFAEITHTGLKVSNYKNEIKDYFVLEHLIVNKDYLCTTEQAGDPAHFHNIKTPNELKALSPGDIVLVATIGAEFVVIGRVINAKSISK